MWLHRPFQNSRRILLGLTFLLSAPFAFPGPSRAVTGGIGNDGDPTPGVWDGAKFISNQGTISQVNPVFHAAGWKNWRLINLS